jgi:hypothetical protein
MEYLQIIWIGRNKMKRLLLLLLPLVMGMSSCRSHNEDDGFKSLRMSIIQPKPTNPMRTPNVVSISDSDKATTEAEREQRERLRRYAAAVAELLSQYEAEYAELLSQYEAEDAELLSQYEAEDAELQSRHEDAIAANETYFENYNAERQRRHEDAIAGAIRAAARARASAAAARARATVEEIDRGHLPHIQQQINNLDDINDPNSNRTEIILAPTPNRNFNLPPADEYHKDPVQPPPPNALTPGHDDNESCNYTQPPDTPLGPLDFDAYNDD